MEEFKLKSKNWILAAVLVCLLGFPAFSQTPEQEVEAVIRSLFDGILQSFISVDGERLTAHQPIAWLRTI